jgi:hypothetical protein
VHEDDVVLSTQGRSFWILSNIGPLRQAADRVFESAAHLFKPADAYRTMYSGSFGGVGSGGDPADPEYPEPGAQIDYWLGAGTTGVVKLDILDGTGAVIRSFLSEGPGQTATTEPSMRRMVTEVSGTPRLTKEPGHNRFTWDLALPGPWYANPARSGRDGPLALPGEYRVRLTAGGTTVTQPLIVRIDPRIARDGVTLAHLREQLEHNIKVRDMVSEVNQLAASIDEGRARLRSAATAADTLKMLEALRAKVVTPAVRYSKPELQAHIQYLYGMTSQADQRIGRDAIVRYGVLRRELDERIEEARKLLGPRVAM